MQTGKAGALNLHPSMGSDLFTLNITSSARKTSQGFASIYSLPSKNLELIRAFLRSKLSNFLFTRLQNHWEKPYFFKLTFYNALIDLKLKAGLKTKISLLRANSIYIKTEAIAATRS